MSERRRFKPTEIQIGDLIRTPSESWLVLEAATSNDGQVVWIKWLKTTDPRQEPEAQNFRASLVFPIHYCLIRQDENPQ